VRVVRLALPPGAATRDGAVLLPIARKLEIGDPAGLELAVGRGGFSRAPAKVGLIQEAATHYRLRIAGAPDYVDVKLEPSPVRALIQMSPKNPVWPFDPVQVDVRVDDGGIALPAGFEPRMVVQVDMNDVPVRWEKKDGGFRARIEPRVPPGPWVVRVEARDHHDNEIGRAFMEVSGPTRP
jgi:hypothetical protein